MDLSEFKKMITKSDKKNIIVGSGIFLFGVFIVWLVLSGADSEADEIGTGGMIVLWSLVGCCLLFGGVLIINPIKSYFSVKSGKHPLVNAIQSGDKGYLVWIYEHVTSVQGGGTDHRIYIYNRDGKMTNLALKQKRIQPTIAFLAEQFPNAVLGYSDDIAARMKQEFGIK